jgi:hypothetical protein
VQSQQAFVVAKFADAKLRSTKIRSELPRLKLPKFVERNGAAKRKMLHVRRQRAREDFCDAQNSF